MFPSHVPVPIYLEFLFLVSVSVSIVAYNLACTIGIESSLKSSTSPRNIEKMFLILISTSLIIVRPYHISIVLRLD